MTMSRKESLIILLWLLAMLVNQIISDLQSWEFQAKTEKRLTVLESKP